MAKNSFKSKLTNLSSNIKRNLSSNHLATLRSDVRKEIGPTQGNDYLKFWKDRLEAFNHEIKESTELLKSVAEKVREKARITPEDIGSKVDKVVDTVRCSETRKNSLYMLWKLRASSKVEVEQVPRPRSIQQSSINVQAAASIYIEQRSNTIECIPSFPSPIEPQVPIPPTPILPPTNTTPTYPPVSPTPSDPKAPEIPNIPSMPGVIKEIVEEYVPEVWESDIGYFASISSLKWHREEEIFWDQPYYEFDFDEEDQGILKLNSGEEWISETITGSVIRGLSISAYGCHKLNYANNGDFSL